MEIVDAYVDGSTFKGQITTWAFVVVANNEVVYSDLGLLEGDILSMYQVGGEINSVKEAIIWCQNKDLKANIYYDYSGIYLWVADLFGDKPWKSKNKWTKAYRQFILDNQQYINQMVKIKSHTGNRWNEYCDQLVYSTLQKYKINL